MKESIEDIIAIFLAELVGTGLLVFFGCMGCIPWFGPPNHLQVVINFGLTVMIMVNVFGMISGAHINPAITAAAYIYKRVSLAMFGVYFAAQMLGGIIGYGLLKFLTPRFIDTGSDNFDSIGLCVTRVNYNISIYQALAIEFLATMVLVMLCCAVWDPRNKNFHDSIALRFGFTVTALACAAGPFTGASMNPARSFGPALLTMDFEDHWIYWVGPMSAGFLTAFAFKAIFYREVVEEKVSTTVDEVGLRDLNNKSTN